MSLDAVLNTVQAWHATCFDSLLNPLSMVHGRLQVVIPMHFIQQPSNCAQYCQESTIE